MPAAGSSSSSTFGLVASALQHGQPMRTVEVDVDDRVFSWTYHPHPALGVVHLAGGLTQLAGWATVLASSVILTLSLIDAAFTIAVA